ncbi:MAG TPA: ABC transporter permease [Gemmatimonadaceae bacterium]|nr:ABC transporter permease [Gemmatimonadaceae bacterium]
MRIEHWIYTVPLRLRSLFRRRQLDQELDEELRYHIQRLAQQYVARGMSPDVARTAAVRAMGGIERRKDECRDTRGVTWLTNSLQDASYGIRLLTRAPGFAAAALLTVALGIAATTAMFSVVYGVVLRPLPFAEPERLVYLWTSAPKLGLPRAFVGVANARDWREQNRVFEDIALVRTIGNFNLTGQGEPERLLGARVSWNLFPLLGVSPLTGRTFTAQEDQSDGDRVVLLSHGLWRRRFGADPGIVGRTIQLSGEPHTVVGIMKPDFTYPGREFQLWTPLAPPPQAYADRLNFSLVGVARLRDGITLERARANLAAINARLARQYPATNDSIGTVVVPMHEDMVSPVKTPLYVLLGAVSGMLLIGCANLANLLLARGLTRRRELAVRATLGASRGRLVAQSVTELLPLFLLGGAMGLLAARWMLGAVGPLLPADLPRAENIGLHLPVLAVAVITLGIITVLAGIWPAVDAGRAGLTASIADLTRSSTAAPRRMRLRDALVVSQIAITLLLVVGATVLMRSFAELREVEPGFTTHRVLSAHLAIPRSEYPSDPEIAALYGRILERIRALPEVELVGMVNRLPLGGANQNGALELEGARGRDVITVTTNWRTVTPDYFRVMGIPLVRGRMFSEADRADVPPVGIIDERLAQAAWPGQDPIGRRMRWGLDTPENLNPWLTVIGVVSDVVDGPLGAPTYLHAYEPFTQFPDGVLNNVPNAFGRHVKVAIRTDGSPRALGSALRSTITGIDPNLAVESISTMEERIASSVAPRRFSALTLAGFAGGAMLLAALGLYGLLAFTVAERRREIAVRLALGAGPPTIVRMVIGQGLKLVFFGVVVGAVAGLAVANAAASLLYGTERYDLVTFSIVPLVLVATALVACAVPAYRAARVESLVVLRAE